MSMNIQVTFPGGKKTTAKSGEPLTKVAARAGFKPTFGCKQGSCGACEVKMNGSKVRICKGKVPASAKPLVVS